ncbi:histone-lysine N-methyltransferase, H3 lysine-9 specific SUVH4-like protein [Carex littledalei]|uniref:Histone-lysine N-methyltransferase, H3 lysine-9 specific SUVH4-like protein n=1 Tax=Carex littledalei TaxID=544730 RepID=A0A833RH61_9POAL|nr:histone-lysine N-methyltransferase, H3 lysine-9 specific SUVH4-like protein [Carex littledalei]
MATLEVSPLLNSELRRSLRLTSKEKPSYMDKIPVTDEIASPKKRARPKKEKPPPKIIPKKSPKKKERPIKEKKVKKSAPKKKSGPPKKKPRLVRNPILEGLITEELAEGDGNLDPLPVAVKSSKTRVKETLRAFTSHYLYFVQAEQRRVQEIEDAKEKKKKSKNAKKKEEDEKAKEEEEDEKAEEEEEDVKRPSKRPDLKAITKMQEEMMVLNPVKRLGHIPGIEVGDQFFSRAEMVVVGLHSHWLNGIDYMGQEYKQVYQEYTFPLASCIVLSGQYEDDLDNADTITYTGQGGHDLLGNKKQISDQKLERGNLALKNSIDNKVPVRVIRGHKALNSYTGKIYTYDGLYMVTDYWPEKGLQKFIVYKYKLKRLEGQKQLTTSQVRFIREDVPQSTADLRGLVIKDISNGQETIPIPATNTVDDPPCFKYIKKLHIPSEIKIPKNEAGCKCHGDCASSLDCPCAKLNGTNFAYVRMDGGRLVEAKSIVYECGAGCQCGPDCINRTSQKDMRYRLEVFKTPTKGWAVRSWDTIPAGAPVCEYTGILKRSDELDCNHFENKYLFDIDCLQTMKGLDGREQRAGEVPSVDPNSESESPVEYCIDAEKEGNVARFINHSCAPNLFVQCVLSSHHDIKLAKVMLFAADTIPPLQELTYDYGYAMDSVVMPDGKVIKLTCHCGAADCRRRLH